MPLIGTVALPPDKSVAHRAMLLAAIGEGTSFVVGYPEAKDPQSTKACVEALGIAVSDEGDRLRVEGRGLRGFSPPAASLDCGNSGTTMRLLAGLLAGQDFDSVLTGDASLSGRPMRRVADPLRAMGARIETTGGHAPLRITGAPLRGIEYRLPVASAQVKSCVLLAGLLAEGETTVVEPVATRDHTERMLGLDVFEAGQTRHITVRGGMAVPARTWHIPCDFSAAAFFLVAGSIVEGSALVLPDVGLNPTRTALLDVLRAMGAEIVVEHERVEGGEPVGHVGVRAAPLHGVTVSGAVTANLIDELPILAVAAACAEGETTVRDAAELRVKETDRIAAICENLRRLGADVTEHEDGFTVRGGRPLHGASVQAYHDHRIAMAMGVAGLVTEGAVRVDTPEVAAVSFPGFWPALAQLHAAGR
jgi:3-phosphoshikimate 1-carboxyvinyltransferase